MKGTKTNRTFKKRTFKRKGVTKRKFTRKGKGKISTAKESLIMKDRTFDKFEIVFITDGSAPLSPNEGLNASPAYHDSYGMLPFFPDNFQNLAGGAMYVFSPQYNITPYNATGPVINVLNGFRLLPGNSLQQVTSRSSFTGTNYFSDLYHQGLPTGVAQWSSFYNKYFCHGSAVEVTLVDATVAGELVVIPITLNDSTTQSSNITYDMIVNPTSYEGSQNLVNLLQFNALPEEQPYAKIKFVSSAGGMDRVKIKHKMTTKKLYDDKLITADNNNAGELKSAVASGGAQYIDPSARQWGWFVGFIPSVPIASVESSTPTQIVTVQVKVTYFCELTDRVQIDYTESS